MAQSENYLWQEILTAIEAHGSPFPSDGAFIIRERQVRLVDQSTVVDTDGYICQIPGAKIISGAYLDDQFSIIQTLSSYRKRGLF